MFRDYAERGEVFKREVLKLAERPDRGDGPPGEREGKRER
jgi:hypothetical protein